MSPLQQAAQALIERWDSPLWKDQPHTAEYVNELRKALEDEMAQTVEPAAWMTQKGESPVPLYLHPPQQVAVTSGERAELLRDLDAWKDSGTKTVGYLIGKAMDMLEADAQQAKQVPMTDEQIQKIYIRAYNIGHHGRDLENAFARAIEAHHGIGGEA